jgi:hypothetical protein
LVAPARRPVFLPVMNIIRLLLPWILAGSIAAAQSAFPGLQTILSPAEWKRAGLDTLTPDQIGVIDAALIRFQAAEQKRLLHLVETPASAAAPPGTSTVEAAVLRSRYWEKFGLEKIKGNWRDEPAMKAKVTAWQGANRFALDTGQVWEGLEQIPFELLGREVAIEARPMNSFVLKLGDDSMAVRVRRVH